MTSFTLPRRVGRVTGGKYNAGLTLNVDRNQMGVGGFKVQVQHF